MSDVLILALRSTGWLAVTLLTATLLVTPLARVAASRGRSRTRLLASRRWFGIATASVACAHTGLATLVYLPRAPWHAIYEVTWLRSGALALTLLLPLLLTSFPALVRFTRVVLWKALHRLVYVVPLLVVHHLALSPFAPRAWVIALAVWLAVVLAVRLLPTRVAEPRA